MKELVVMPGLDPVSMNPECMDCGSEPAMTARFHASGVTQSRVAAIERNPAAVSAGQLLDLLKVLGVDLVLRDKGAPASNTSPQGEW